MFAHQGIPAAKRKFAELELSLLHLQQNLEIPDTHLVIHPAIERAVEQAKEAGQRSTLDWIQPGTLLTDVSFLNRLQSDVNLWIKEIQSVTKLNRDVSSGTASQEINFWLSMERAINGIEAQLGGDQVQLTLLVLKNAKRFHATTSFVSDTGLKEATDTVTKYNVLMREFPLNELLSATDLEKIKEGLYMVFGHMNKRLKIT
jgi:dynein heavy chain 1